MKTVLTKDLQPRMTIRHPWSTVWEVTSVEIIKTNGHDSQYEITMRHGTEEKTLTEWDWEHVEHILCDRCGSMCFTDGNHTGW